MKTLTLPKNVEKRELKRAVSEYRNTMRSSIPNWTKRSRILNKPT